MGLSKCTLDLLCQKGILLYLTTLTPTFRSRYFIGCSLTFAAMHLLNLSFGLVQATFHLKDTQLKTFQQTSRRKEKRQKTLSNITNIALNYQVIINTFMVEIWDSKMKSITTHHVKPSTKLTLFSLFGKQKTKSHS